MRRVSSIKGLKMAFRDKFLASNIQLTMRSEDLRRMALDHGP